MKLFTKTVDKSLLWEGLTVPVAEEEKLCEAVGEEFEIGNPVDIRIIIKGQAYSVKLKKTLRKQSKSSAILIQIRYNHQSEIAKKLRSIFTTTEYYVEHPVESSEGKLKICVPEELQEYVEIRSIDGTNDLEFQCITVADDVELDFISSIDEESLKHIAVEHSSAKAEKKNIVQREVYHRDQYIAEYAKRVAHGRCQLCGKVAPFLNKNGQPYLESHHIVWLSEGGKDSIDNVVALCPNCHRKMHILNDKDDIDKLKVIKVK